MGHFILWRRTEQLAKLSECCLANAESLPGAFRAVSRMGIDAFQVLSPIFPRYTQTDMGYGIDFAPDSGMLLWMV
jgi:hypothetical protein